MIIDNNSIGLKKDLTILNIPIIYSLFTHLFIIPLSEDTSSTHTAEYKQWTLVSNETGYSISNKGPDGTLRFYKVVDGEYGQPLIIAEPDLAFPVPENVEYVDARGNIVEPKERISGIICQRVNDLLPKETIHRFSLSSPKAPLMTHEDGGALNIEGVSWHLRVLLQKDKNRIFNYDAFYGNEKPDSVKVLELGDLDF